MFYKELEQCIFLQAIMVDRTPAYNISYPSSAAAVVFCGHLSAQAAFSALTGNRPQSAPACSFLRYRPYWSPLDNGIGSLTKHYFDGFRMPKTFSRFDRAKLFDKFLKIGDATNFTFMTSSVA